MSALHITHDPDKALALADRVAVMGGRRIVQVDTPIGVFTRPKTLLAARAFGRLNLLLVQVQQGQIQHNGHVWDVEDLQKRTRTTGLGYEVPTAHG